MGWDRRNRQPIDKFRQMGRIDLGDVLFEFDDRAGGIGIQSRPVQRVALIRILSAPGNRGRRFTQRATGNEARTHDAGDAQEFTPRQSHFLEKRSMEAGLQRCSDGIEEGVTRGRLHPRGWRRAASKTGFGREGS